jgi:hypothetical protein
MPSAKNRRRRVAASHYSEGGTFLCQIESEWEGSQECTWQAHFFRFIDPIFNQGKGHGIPRRYPGICTDRRYGAFCPLLAFHGPYVGLNRSPYLTGVSLEKPDASVDR